MNIQLLFPTAIGISENFISDQENEIVVDESYRLKESLENAENHNWLAGEKAPYNTHQNVLAVLNNDKLSFLNKKISQAVHEFAVASGDMDTYIANHAWINIYSDGRWQEPHYHGNVMYSAVYFPLASDKSGEIVFQSPIVHQMTSVYGGESFYQPRALFQPVSKMLVVFKSSTSHYVLSNKDKKDRISMAYNFVLHPEIYMERNKRFI